MLLLNSAIYKFRLFGLFKHYRPIMAFNFIRFNNFNFLDYYVRHIYTPHIIVKEVIKVIKSNKSKCPKCHDIF